MMLDKDLAIKKCNVEKKVRGEGKRCDSVDHRPDL
jgi:hypothetical protein